MFDNDRENVPGGFVVARPQFYDQEEGVIRTLTLLLPSSVSTQIIKDARYLAEANQEVCELIRKQEAAKKANADTPYPSKPPQPQPAAAKRGAETFNLNAERIALNDKFLQSALLSDANDVEIYDKHEPLKLIEQSSLSHDSEVQRRNGDLYRQLKAKGNSRRILKNSNTQQTLRGLDKLKNAQPHFGEVVDLVRQQVLLAQAKNEHLKLPPILLNGDPGVGKTFFSQALGDVLNTVVHRHSLDNAETESSLTGSARTWGNTMPGMMFELVCLGATANPIVLLDEIDKATTYQSRNPLGPLHTLLEPLTSRAVTDISVCMTFDCSHVMYIATANIPSRIPASIRSRFTQFDIQIPTGGHAIRVAQGVADAIHAEMNLPDFFEPTERIVTLLAHLVPREQCQVLRRAYASAIANDRQYIERGDLPAHVLIDDQDDLDSSTPLMLH